jgi:hypothetical protein
MAAVLRNSLTTTEQLRAASLELGAVQDPYPTSAEIKLRRSTAASMTDSLPVKRSKLRSNEVSADAPFSMTYNRETMAVTGKRANVAEEPGSQMTWPMVKFTGQGRAASARLLARAARPEGGFSGLPTKAPSTSSPFKLACPSLSIFVPV